eukprot:gene10086-7057_t
MNERWQANGGVYWIQPLPAGCALCAAMMLDAASCALASVPRRGERPAVLRENAACPMTPCLHSHRSEFVGLTPRARRQSHDRKEGRSGTTAGEGVGDSTEGGGGSFIGRYKEVRDGVEKNLNSSHAVYVPSSVFTMGGSWVLSRVRDTSNMTTLFGAQAQMQGLLNSSLARSKQAPQKTRSMEA